MTFQAPSFGAERKCLTVKHEASLLILFICLSASGQCQDADARTDSNTLPDSPSITLKDSSNHSGTLRSEKGFTEAPPILNMVFPSEVKTRRVADREFFVLQILNLAATVADIESTRYAQRHGGTEISPLVGSRPSITTLYAISIPANIGISFWSYRLKSKAPHSRNWRIPPVISGAMHAGAAAYNVLR